MSVLRSIVHMDLDTFFVSCERLLDSRLVVKPILLGRTSDLGVVASCSYEARQFGIHSAMPMKMAKVSTVTMERRVLMSMAESFAYLR
mgnify:CR=1 FL=1